jgi:dihydrodipicolinate synthase/N-acetylneuraminate lyase
MAVSEFDVRAHLLRGQVIPAHPLALHADRRLDERRQRALTRYYVDAGAGGIAVGVHTTQFGIREPQYGLLEPVLALAAETVAGWGAGRPIVKIAGVCGGTTQALAEARLAVDLGYHAGLVSMAGWGHASDDVLLEHCRAVGDVIPLFGFYLQPAVGGRLLGERFWRGLAELPSLVAIKIAPFDRYETAAVVRSIAASGRTDVALYTGNDDHIVLDLLTEYPASQTGGRAQRIVGGLLGHWAVWTQCAVELLKELHASEPTAALISRAAAITDANGALFDPRHGFHGSIPGLHEVLRRQRLLEGRWCLDPKLELSPGQLEEIERVLSAYPWMQDDDFVAERLDDWLT